ncbi:MAG: helix-hairpin-helix protein [Cohnella sp.]|nr:helix-hairpin-helix protein [Cohnella sp.]
MAYFAVGKKRRNSKALAAWAVAGAGAAVLIYSQLQPSGAAIPGWQPVNDSVRTTLAAHSSSQPKITPGTAAVTAPASRPAASNDGASAPTASTDSAFSPAPSPSSSPAAKPASAANPGVLELNSATEADFDRLPGIGPAKAKTIVAYREAHRGFRKIEELLQVKGIGPKLFDKIRSQVSIAPTTKGP